VGNNKNFKGYVRNMLYTMDTEANSNSKNLYHLFEGYVSEANPEDFGRIIAVSGDNTRSFNFIGYFFNNKLGSFSGDLEN
jgi:hypothetical protein